MDTKLLNTAIFNSAELFMQIVFTPQDSEKAALWFAYFWDCHDIGKFVNGFQQLLKHDNLQLVAADPAKRYISRHDSLDYWL